MALIVSIDGNIGSGKSTIVNNLKQVFVNEDIIFLEEPINEWNKIKDDDKSILEKYYEDPEKYAYCFQMMTFITRYNLMDEIIKKNPNSIIVTERSLYTDKYIFAKMLNETKKINTIEYQVYNKWFDKFITNLPKHKYIYIINDPHKCLENIKKRNRKGEDAIDISYLELCNKAHDEMFIQIEPDLVINISNHDLSSSGYNKILNQIRTFILNQPNKYNNESSLLLLLTLSFFYSLIFLLILSDLYILK
jgi:deoxyadenosine/deoxycytidine kinase